MFVPAHGVGGAQDLPIPAPLAIAGAATAVALSFLILAVAWRKPRLGSGRALTVPPAVTNVVDSAAFAVMLRGAGLMAFGYVAWAALAGPDIVTNPTFGVVYVLLWVGIVPASLALGPVWKAISPARGIYAIVTRLIGGQGTDALAALPKWVGLWPASIGLFAFVWLELVYEQSTYLAPLRLWFAIYFAVLLVGAAIFGEDWFERADPFEVCSTLIANLAPWGRDAVGQLVVRTPLEQLSRMPRQPGLVAVTAVLLGSTAFDSFARSSTWLRFIAGRDGNTYLYATLTLAAVCLFVFVTFSAAAMAVPSKQAASRRHLPALFAPSLVPIIVGYVTAHYMSMLVEFGKVVLIQLSDPMVNGSNLFGTANWEATYPLSRHPTMLASIKVLAVLVGHVAGVVVAHQQALKTLPERIQVWGQLPMLAVMLIYTSGGLFLLFNG